MIGSEINQLAQAESVFFQEDERTYMLSNNSILMFILALQIRSFATLRRVVCSRVLGAAPKYQSRLS